MMDLFSHLSCKVFSVLCVGIIFLTTASASYAQEAMLKASIQTKDPLKPVLQITNTNADSCQIVQSATGTVSITSVRQDGREIQPLPIQVGLDESLEIVLANKLATLAPGKTAEMPLQMIPYQSAHALQTITWSQESGAFGMIYPLDTKKPYIVEATYVAPITPLSGPPLCGMAQATTVSPTSDTETIVKLVIIVALIILLKVLLRLLHSRKRRNVAVVTAGLLLLLAPTNMVKLTYAEYSVPESASAQFDACMATLNSHRDITGPILDALAGRNVEIVPTDDRTNDATGLPDGSFRIYWDPESTYNYYSDDGTTISSTPCDRLFHELYHAYDMANGTFSREACGDSGIETKEVMAVRAQNRLRAALGLSPRTHYGRDRLPAGDCTPPETPTCTGSCAESNGDPHLKTFDKRRYDFQAVGEFVAARDVRGGFEVQTRQEAWPNSRDVSVNTAVALLVEKDTVEIQIYKNTPSLLINGKRTTLGKKILPSGGTIVPKGTRDAIVLWPDGSAVHTHPIGAFGLHVIVNPAASRSGHLEGLLGNFNDDKTDDIKARGAKTPIEPDFDKLYPTFADSWRITESGSLFTYDPGKSTKTYTDKTFPDKQVQAKDLPNRKAAETLCRSKGITDPEILENCILDVALTGRPEFAQAAKRAQHVTQTTDYGGKKWHVAIKEPGEVATVTFEGKANEKIFLSVSQATLPDQCGNLDLIAPNARHIASGCIINGQGMIDGTVLPETGTYTLSLRSAQETTGTALLQLLTITDQTGTIQADKGDVIAEINKPGVTAEFRFEGQAGQKVFVDIPTTTLPDQCGGIGIKTADDRVLNSGCIIGKSGYINTTVLPHDGQYTVFIDPSNHNTGQATLRLIQTQDFKANIRLNGPAVKAHLPKPGSVVELTFSARAGQRVFIDFSASTIPDQCGGIELNAPDGKSVGSGCIIGGKGRITEEGLVLPQTGDYTILIDPADRKVGQLTIHARL